MNLGFDISDAQGYISNSQISRILTEKWTEKNIYCPSCGSDHIVKFQNNRPAADFYCDYCREEYELKSKGGALGGKVNDGAYDTMIERIGADNNPNFFFLTYSKTGWTVDNFIVIPKFYFTPSLIERRRPLSQSARRSGWTGCNILLGAIPERGKLFLIKNSDVTPKEEVVKKWGESEFLKQESHVSRGWLLDTMRCVDGIREDTFTLDEMYGFEGYLKQRHPDNNFVKDKIRQQLQLLRDKGIIEFVSRGVYRKRK